MQSLTVDRPGGWLCLRARVRRLRRSGVISWFIVIMPMIAILIASLMLYMMVDNLSSHWGMVTKTDIRAFSESGGILSVGAYANGIRAFDPRVAFDGRFVKEGSQATLDDAIIWDEPYARLSLHTSTNTIMYGFTIQADGDDIYVIEVSDNGIFFNTIATLKSDRKGMVTYSSIPASPYFQEDLYLPPEHHGYIRIRAVGGTPPFAISEIAIIGRYLRGE